LFSSVSERYLPFKMEFSPYSLTSNLIPMLALLCCYYGVERNKKKFGEEIARIRQMRTSIGENSGGPSGG
jgi:hypothetical protein